MANVAVTYTFSNGTTADASQVSQNFTDIINGTSDGTKDFSISALTCAGNVTLNGNTTIGNASGDDLTVTASLASSIGIKTTFSYDIGAATLGLRYLFLGSSDSAARTTKIAGATVASSYTFTLPTSGGTVDYSLRTDGSGTTSWAKDWTGSYDVRNYSIATSVAGNALTITLKGADGNDLSATNYIDACFRSTTITASTVSQLKLTSNLTLTISSGSTLGHANAVPSPIYVYLLNASGTPVLAASTTLSQEGALFSTTAEGGAGAADSATVMYSTAAQSGVAGRLIAMLTSTQSTAGTWAAVPTRVDLHPLDRGSVGTYGQQRFIMMAARITYSAGTPSVNIEAGGDWISSLTDTAQGQCTINCYQGASPTGRITTANPEESLISGTFCTITTDSAATILVRIRDAAAALQDENFRVVSIGY